MSINAGLFRISRAEKYFAGTKYGSKVMEAVKLYNQDKVKEANVIMDSLPTSETLMERLAPKLRGKSVYTTLKKIGRGKVESTAEVMKGLFSLGTHVCIEIEKGNLEYRMLLEDIYSRIGKDIFNLGR